MWRRRRDERENFKATRLLGRPRGKSALEVDPDRPVGGDYGFSEDLIVIIRRSMKGEDSAGARLILILCFRRGRRGYFFSGRGK